MSAGSRPGLRKRYYQWMYRGGRPNRWARWQNRLSVAMFSPGLIMTERLVTMEVPGRRSGRIISFPLVVADHAGERYLVAMLGERVNWVANVRAAGGRAVLRHGRREAVRLEEVEVARRAPILRRYMAVAPGGRPHLPVDRHAPLAEFEKIAPGIPVFRITPDTTPPTPPSDITPSDATPSDATPSDATPSDATPSDATPSDATPSDTTPSDHTETGAAD